MRGNLKGVFSGFFLRFGFAAGKIELRWTAGVVLQDQLEVAF